MKSLTQQLQEPGVSIGFGPAREILLGYLRDLERLAADRGDSRLAETAAEVSGKLRGNQLSLAVLGQFKRGKTTFLNSLLGVDLLPVGVLPATSTVTILRYADAPEAQVRFLSGETRPIALPALADYVTERGNPRNAKGVKEVEVGYPSPYLREGVLLVDTPGVGSVHQHNTEITHAFLAQADAAIVLLAVDPPLTQVEADFLRRTKEEVHHFSFVLNKIDLMSAAEMRETLNFTAAHLAELAGFTDCQVYPLSAREALLAKSAGDSRRLEASGLPVFEKALAAFLMADKGRVMLEAALADTLRVAGNLRFAMELERQALMAPLEELERKRLLLLQQLRQVEREREDMNVLLRDDVSRCIQRVEADLQANVEDSLPGSLRGLEEFLHDHPSPGRAQLGRLVDEFVAAEVERVFQEWRRTEDHRMNQTFSELAGRFAEKTNAILRQIGEITAGLFEFSAEAIEGPDLLRAGANFYYRTDPLFYFALDKAPFILPWGPFRKHAVNKARERMREELDRNSGRIRFDYLQRIEKSTEEFRGRLNRRIDAALEGVRHALERAVERKRESQDRCGAHAGDYQSECEQLGTIVRSCRALAAKLGASEESGHAV